MCSKNTGILVDENKGCLLEIKEQIVKMTLSGPDIRDASRVLNIGINTVLSELKKQRWITCDILLKRKVTHADYGMQMRSACLCFGARKNKIFSQLKALWTPVGIQYVYTDDWGSYQRKPSRSQHIISQTNTQKIERYYYWIINRYEFGVKI